jgi:Skp family chaperone for outer membrane proteins
MKMIRFAAFATLILATSAASALAQQSTQAGVGGLLPDGKVVVINTSVFPERIGEMKQKYEQVNSQFRDRYQKLQDLNKQAQTLENEIQTQGNVLTPDKLQEKQSLLADLKKRGSRELEDFQNDYSKALEAATKPVRDKLSAFIQNYAAQRGIIMIIDLPNAYQNGYLAYVSPSADITDDFINEYNKANPVPTAATPAAQPAQKPGTPAPVPPKPNKP